jgi:hypothetical protein
MATRIRIRRDTSANWESNNPVLALAELGLETDTLKLKAGDGTQNWNDLDYIAGEGGTVGPVLNDIEAINGAEGDSLTITPANGESLMLNEVDEISAFNDGLVRFPQGIITDGIVAAGSVNVFQVNPEIDSPNVIGPLSGGNPTDLDIDINDGDFHYVTIVGDANFGNVANLPQTTNDEFFDLQTGLSGGGRLGSTGTILIDRGPTTSPGDMIMNDPDTNSDWWFPPNSEFGMQNSRFLVIRYTVGIGKLLCEAYNPGPYAN